LLTRHIPNLLSLARLLLAPYLFLLLWRRQYGAALVVILIAGISDGLDGLLARRLGASSKLGAYLDPIADKVLLSGAFLTLALDGAMEPWVAGVVLGRDAAILLFAGGALLFTKTRRSFPPSIWGKVSTAVQIAFVVALVGPVVFAIQPLKWLTVVLAGWSGLDYLRRALRGH
jgi:cardiolipin synthase (CMP-forming)